MGGYRRDRTGLLLVDPYNDFLSESIESTSRFAMELGYHGTLVKDATAAFSKEMMHAAHELNGPTFAHAIVTTLELVAALPAPRKEQR